MSPQGAVPETGNREFGLIETFRWSRAGGYAYFEEHLDRLAASARALDFACERIVVENALWHEVRHGDDGDRRVRLVLARDGTVTISVTPLGRPLDGFRVMMAAPRHQPGDPGLRHKTTLRDRYERPLAEAVAAHGVDEVLFLNERGELCEGARSNLFVRRGDRLLTPPLACGLLPGTLRAHLLCSGEAHEAVLHLDDLAVAEVWHLGNSVRGLVRSTLVTPANTG